MRGAGGAPSPLGREDAQRVGHLLRPYPHADLHRVDWMVLRDLARAHPHAGKEELMGALRAGSPRIEERKRTHVYDDAERTVRYVLLDPDVERVRRAATREADRARDRWF